MTDFKKPGVSIDVEGFHIVSEEVSEKVQKKNISPSMITSLENCPAKWLGDTMVIRDLITEEPDNAARRGSLFHKVMEDFFAEDSSNRTTKKVKEIVSEVLSSEEFKDMAEIPEAVDWLKKAINGYYSMGAKPEKVKVASIKNKDGDDKLGLEVFVKGRIGDSKRETLGFIDRLVEHPKKKDSVVIEDWKTGAKVKRWNPKTKGTEGLPEARQQVIYSELLKKQGVDVSGARLIFPVVQEIVNVDLNDKSFLERVINDVEETDIKLDVFIENNTFEYNPSFLCAWCPMAKVCPAATIKPYDKMRDAYAQQPEPEILQEGFEFN